MDKNLKVVKLIKTRNPVLDLRKTQFLEILDTIREQVENDELDSLAVLSTTVDNEVQVNAMVPDVVLGLGMFELAKQIFLESYYDMEE